MGVANNNNLLEEKKMDTSIIVKNSQTALVRCTRIAEKADQTNTNSSTTYDDDNPKYVVDVLEGVVSKITDAFSRAEIIHNLR